MVNQAFAGTNVDQMLPLICSSILQDGTEVPSRLGDSTTELTQVAVKLTRPWEREILLPSRRASVVAQIAESAWILAGRNDIEWLSHYLPRAKDFSDDGETWRGAYGPRLRGGQGHWPGIDQLAHVRKLLLEDPTTRRALINIYDPNTDTKPGKDIPCNNWLHFLIRDGKLQMHVVIRSNDLIWGWSGINAFEWSVVQEMMASWVGVLPGELHFSISSLHIYDRHVERASRIASDFAPVNLETSPTWANCATPEELEEQLEQFFTIEMRSRQDIFAELGESIEKMPNPVLQSWMRVLAAHNSGDLSYLEPLKGTRLHAAYLLRPQPKRQAEVASGDADAPSDFVAEVSALHAEKHAAYGDSWKRRGELFSIIPNIARKVDRLEGGAETADETQLDTAIDLLVYLAKYRWWLVGVNGSTPMPTVPGNADIGDEVARVRELLSAIRHPGRRPESELVGALTVQFERLLKQVEDKAWDRYRLVDEMLETANALARLRHWKAGNAARPWNPEA